MAASSRTRRRAAVAVLLATALIAGPAAASAATFPAAAADEARTGRSLLQGWGRGGNRGNGNGNGGSRDGGGGGSNDAFSGRLIVPAGGDGNGGGGSGGGGSPFGGGRLNSAFGGNGNNRNGGSSSGNGSPFDGGAFGGGRPTTRPFPSADGAFGPRPVVVGGGGSPFDGGRNRPAFGGLGGGGLNSAFGDRNNNNNNNNNAVRDYSAPVRVAGRNNNNGDGAFGGLGNNIPRINGNNNNFNANPIANNNFFADRNNGDGGRPVRVINANNNNGGGGGGGDWNRPPARVDAGRGNINTRPVFNGGGLNDINNNNNNNWNGPPGQRPYRVGELNIQPGALASPGVVPRTTGLPRPSIDRGGGGFNPAFRDRVYRGFGGTGDFGARTFGGRADANAVAQTIAQAGGAADATAAAEAVVEAARGGRATAVAEAYARAAKYNRGGAARVMARSAAVAYERGDPYVQSLASSTAQAFTAARAAGTLGDFAGAMAEALATGGQYGQATFGQAMAQAMATTEGQAAVAEATASVFCGPGTYATAWAEAMSVALSRDSRGCLVLNRARALAVARCNGGVFSAEAKAEATSRVLGFCGLGPWSGGGGGGGGNWGGPIGAVPLPGRGGGGLAQNILNRIGDRIGDRGGFGSRAPFERASAGADAEASAFDGDGDGSGAEAVADATAGADGTDDGP